MENKPSPWPLALKFGLIAGLLNALVSLVFYLLNTDVMSTSGNWIQSIINWIITLSVLIVAGKQRAKELDNHFTYNNGFGFSLLLGLPFSFLMMVYIYAYFAFINPEMLTSIQEKQMEAMQNRGLSDEEIDMQMSTIQKFSSPIAYSLFSIFGSMLQVLILGLISAIFTKKTSTHEEGTIA